MGKATKKRRQTAGVDKRLRQMDSLLVSIDTPNEGDAVIFMLEGDDTRYRGKVVKRLSSDKGAHYKIESNTKLEKKSNVVMVEYKGKKFKTGNKKV